MELSKRTITWSDFITKNPELSGGQLLIEEVGKVLQAQIRRIILAEIFVIFMLDWVAIREQEGTWRYHQFDQEYSYFTTTQLVLLDCGHFAFDDAFSSHYEIIPIGDKASLRVSDILPISDA